MLAGLLSRSFSIRADFSQSPNHALKAFVRTCAHWLSSRLLGLPFGAFMYVPSALASRTMRSVSVSDFPESFVPFARSESGMLTKSSTEILSASSRLHGIIVSFTQCQKSDSHFFSREMTENFAAMSIGLPPSSMISCDIRVSTASPLSPERRECTSDAMPSSLSPA